jgi:hypothetical protein
MKNEVEIIGEDMRQFESEKITDKDSSKHGYLVNETVQEAADESGNKNKRKDYVN